VKEWRSYVIQDSQNTPPNINVSWTKLTAVDTATSVAHPLTLTPSSAPELALVGVGVRTVSFLSFKVYSAGFYANDYTLKRLRSVPGWDKFEPTQFAGPGGEELVQKLMDLPTAVAVRIGT